MKFEIGKEYKTRSRSKAGIFCDLSTAPDFRYDYPLKGYIERADGIRGDAAWTIEGKFTALPAIPMHPFDLMPPVKELEIYTFATWAEDQSYIFTYRTLKEAQKERDRWRRNASAVSSIVAAKLTEDIEG